MLARLVFLVLLTAASASPAWGAVEQRCNDLGANCVCSEPLNTNSFPAGIGGGNNFWQNPADTTSGDKQCTLIDTSFPGNTFETTSNGNNFVFGANTGEAWNNLPATARAGRSFIARGPDGHGSMDLGHFGIGSPSSGNGLVVRAARWYVYHSASPAYGFTNHSVGCTNSKFLQVNGGSGAIHIKHIGGDASGANFNDGHLLQWGPNFQDCCQATWPNSLIPESMRGKWLRVEVHIVNPQGPNARYRNFVKNITDNTPEIMITDTASSGSGWIGVTNAQPRDPGGNITYLNMVRSHQFRGGSCAGHNAWMNYMMAKWDTETTGGQLNRIGAAVEVEGTGVAPLNTPTNLRQVLLNPFAILATAWRWLTQIA